MNGELTILGIAGSLRAGSYNRAALRAAYEAHLREHRDTIITMLKDVVG